MSPERKTAMERVRESWSGMPAYYIDHKKRRTVIRCWRTLEPIITITYHGS